MPRWLFIALVVFLCIVGAMAAGLGVYRIGEENVKPVPGRSLPSATIEER